MHQKHSNPAASAVAGMQPKLCFDPSALAAAGASWNVIYLLGRYGGTLDLEQAALELGITPGAARTALHQRGTFPLQPLGKVRKGRLRFSTAALAAYLDGRVAQGPAPAAPTPAPAKRGPGRPRKGA